MWELDHKECWALKNWCFWHVLDKTLESSLDSKEIKPVNPQRNQSWIFIGRTDDEAEAPIFWPPDAKSQLIGKDPNARKNWRQEEKGMTEDEMIGWHHRLNGHEFEQAPGDGEREGSLVCYNPWGHKQSARLWLNNNRGYSKWHIHFSAFFFFLLLRLGNLNWLIFKFVDLSAYSSMLLKSLMYILFQLIFDYY